MTILYIGALPDIQRQAVLQTIQERHQSIDWIAKEIDTPTECLRRWLNNDEPETNRQRFEWHRTHQAVELFLATQL